MKRPSSPQTSALAITFAGSAASGVSTSEQPTPKTPDAVSVVEDGVRKAPRAAIRRGRVRPPQSGSAEVPQG